MKNNFCENANKNCTLNYCDTNGCSDRKREYVETEEQLFWEQNNTFEVYNEEMYIDKNVGKIKKRFEKLKHNNLDWDSFYIGFLEGLRN